MFGPYVSKVLQYALGYLYPAYANYKALNAKNSQAIREWSIYWLVLAVFMLLELVADRLVFWLPLYYELKLAYIVALWHPQTKFAITVYEKMIAPMLQYHEPQIDKSFSELKTKAVDYMGNGIQQARYYSSRGITEAQRYIKRNLPSKGDAVAPSPAAAAAAAMMKAD